VSRDKSHTLASILRPALRSRCSPISAHLPAAQVAPPLRYIVVQHGLSLNTIANLNATDFQVTIPQATASALMSDSNTRVIQNPQIRALDGQKATLKIGDRVPWRQVVPAGNWWSWHHPLVNTQFQYLDVA